MQSDSNKLQVFMPCSGLGRVRRGFESFTEELHNAIQCEKRISATIFKGSGYKNKYEIPIWNIPRTNRAGKILGRIAAGRGGYFVEQLSFFLSLVPYLETRRPDVVLFSDGNLGNLLWRWRRFRGLRYKLLFSNGGPLSPPFPRWDFVHQISSLHYQSAKLMGQTDDRQTYIPYGSNIASALPVEDITTKSLLRHKLGLPKDRVIILSVAVINASHKRLDYVIRELASLPLPRPFLVMLGESDVETPAILKLAHTLLGATGYIARTVKRKDVACYYTIADLFVLASIREGMGKVLVEALAGGLPCLAHDYPVAREVLGKFGYYGNFNMPGSLALLLQTILSQNHSGNERHARHRYAYETYSWDQLHLKYSDLLCHCAKVTYKSF